MTSPWTGWLSRRQMLHLLGAGGATAAFGLPDKVFAQTRKTTLVLGIDISDTITLDPARLAQYTSPMTVSAAYDSLVTRLHGDERVVGSRHRHRRGVLGKARRTAKVGALRYAKASSSRPAIR